MIDNPHRRIVVILGPTAGGKSELTAGVARALDGEVINADSMQVYRHLNAGTAKPTPEQLAVAPHHLIDVVEPSEAWSVSDWLDVVERIIARLHDRGKLPIVVGGTNLYIKSLLEGMFEAPPAEPEFRRQLFEIPGYQLHERLARIDAPAAQRIHPNDHKRIVRALEVHHTTGHPISAWQNQWNDQERGKLEVGNSKIETPLYRHNPILIGLRWPRDRLNRRINARVKRMFQPESGRESLVEETRRLCDVDLLGPQAREALGTKQVLAYLEGGLSLDEARERTKIDTRRLAKSQRSWLKRYRGVHWLDAADTDFEQLTNQALTIVRKELHN